MRYTSCVAPGPRWPTVARIVSASLLSTWILFDARADDAPLALDCLIEPAQTIDLRSPVPGVIERVTVERGSRVTAGALVASLDSRVERAAVALARYRSTMEGPSHAAESRLTHADSKVKRRRDLESQSYTSAQDREDAEAEQRAAAADLEVARENKALATLEYDHAASQLALREIHSPIGGVVVEVYQHPGELAEASENKPAILTVAEINPLRVKAIVPLAQFPRIRAGMAAEVTPESPLTGRYAATVRSVDKLIDAASGTFQVRFDLPNPDGKLPAGVKCRVTIDDAQVR